jgi:hypothetical protein
MNRVTAVVVAAVLALPAALAAQESTQYPHTRAGTWFSIGGGFGSAGTTGDGFSSAKETGPVGILRVGGTYSPSLLLGGEVVAWGRAVDGSTVIFGFASAIGQYYLEPTGPFFLKAGLGLATYRVTFDDDPDGSDTEEESGVGLTIGFGYDYRFGANVSLTPQVSYHRAFGMDVRPSVLQLGVSLTWH